MGIVVALLIFGILVLAHEWGHFIIAKKNGITVEEFAIGMGPLIYGKEKSGTLFSIRLLPIGGYCKMLGEDEKLEEENVEGSFNSKSILQRMAVISAGSIMNFILSFFLVLILVFGNGFTSTAISTLLPDSPAEEVGLMPGDRIISIDGVRLRTFLDIRFALSNVDGPIDIVIQRNNERINKHLTPMTTPEGASLIGFVPVSYGGFFNPIEGGATVSIPEFFSNAFWTMIHYVRLVLHMLGQLFTFNVAMGELAGPVGIVSMIDSVYAAASDLSLWQTLVPLLTLGALLSVNLGVANLLPIPALDGGRLVFLIIEAIRGKPVSPEKEGIVHFVGLVLLLGLMFVVTFNDIVRLFTN